MGYLIHFNENHDPKNGRFTFNKNGGVSATGGYGKANPNDYRTQELDKKYAELKRTGATEINNLKWLHNDDNAEKVWGKDFVKSATLGIHGLNDYRSWGWNDSDIQDFIKGTMDNAHRNAMLNWFVFEDQTPGFAEISHLVYKGWSKDKIMNMIRTCDYDFNDQNNKFSDAYTGYPNNKNWDKLFNEAYKKEPYPGTYSLGETLSSGTDDYIDACINAKKQLQHSGVDEMDYLIHYNKNHSSKNGQFTSGDGDGDGIANDHAHRSGNSSRRSGGSSNRNSSGGLTAQQKKNRRILGSGYAMWGASFLATATTMTLGNLYAETDSKAALAGGIVSAAADIALTSAGLANIYRGRARIANER